MILNKSRVDASRSINFGPFPAGTLLRSVSFSALPGDNSLALSVAISANQVSEAGGAGPEAEFEALRHLIGGSSINDVTGSGESAPAAFFGTDLGAGGTVKSGVLPMNVVLDASAPFVVVRLSIMAVSIAAYTVSLDAIPPGGVGFALNR